MRATRLRCSCGAVREVVSVVSAETFELVGYRLVLTGPIFQIRLSLP